MTARRRHRSLEADAPWRTRPKGRGPTKEQVWEAYDLFLALGSVQPDRTIAITRECFAAEPPLTTEALRLMKRSRIYAQLHQCSDPVDCAGFFRLCFPLSDAEEEAQHAVWAVWRGVQRAFEEEEFEGSVEDFEHAFAALATDGALDRGELARTGLLSRAEVAALDLPEGPIDAEHFTDVVRPVLAAKYVSPETQHRLDQERRTNERLRRAGRRGDPSVFDLDLLTPPEKPLAQERPTIQTTVDFAEPAEGHAKAPKSPSLGDASTRSPSREQSVASAERPSSAERWLGDHGLRNVFARSRAAVETSALEQRVSVVRGARMPGPTLTREKTTGPV